MNKKLLIIFLIFVSINQLSLAQEVCIKNWVPSQLFTFGNDDPGDDRLDGIMLLHKLPDVKSILADENTYINLDLQVEDWEYANIIGGPVISCRVSADKGKTFFRDGTYELTYQIENDDDEVASFTQNGNRVNNISRICKYSGSSALFKSTETVTIYFNRNHWNDTKGKIKVKVTAVDRSNLPEGHTGRLTDDNRETSWEFKYDSKMKAICPITIENAPPDIAEHIVTRVNRQDGELIYDGTVMEHAYTYNLLPAADYSKTTIIETFENIAPMFDMNMVRPEFLMEHPDLNTIERILREVLPNRPIGVQHSWFIGDNPTFTDKHGGFEIHRDLLYEFLTQADIDAGRLGFVITQNYRCKGNIIAPNNKILTKRVRNIVWDRGRPTSAEVVIDKH